MAGSDPRKLMTKADKLTKLTLTRWSADWKSATVLYEQAANGFRVVKDYERAKEAYEKASKGQEMLSSPWDAAKHIESAAALAKELSHWREVGDFYRRASELYIECGRSQPASDALAKGARALEDSMPEEAIQLYTDACTVLEEDGREQMAFDLYRATTNVHVKLEKYRDAAACLLRLGLAADKCNATNSQCKAYLSAILVYLFARDFKEAEKCYNDCSQIDAFLRSDQNRCASRLLAAYTEGDIEEIKRIANSSTISNLDHVETFQTILQSLFQWFSDLHSFPTISASIILQLFQELLPLLGSEEVFPHPLGVRLVFLRVLRLHLSTKCATEESKPWTK